MQKKHQDKLIEKIEQALQTVYDPEFPLVDIYTLGLIYTIEHLKEKKKIIITMSFTTPTCPMAEYLIESVKNAVISVTPNYEIHVEISFDPMWNPKMIRDEDLQRMFEI